MLGKMIMIDYQQVYQETHLEKFRERILQYGFDQSIGDFLCELIIEINNSYADADYHLIYPTYYQDDRNYIDDLFRYVNVYLLRCNISYLRLFFDDDGKYTAIPAYRRLMRKSQTGTDTSSGGSTVKLLNSNSPINLSDDVENPTSKSNSTSTNNGSVIYNNQTDYDNINETEMSNYYKRFETLNTWVRKNLFDHLIYEYGLNNW